MHRALAIASLAAFAAEPRALAQQRAAYLTEFTFASYYAGTRTSYAPEPAATVAMPAGSAWRCTKSAIFRTASGNFSGMFSCWSGEVSTYTFATCDPLSASSDYGYICATQSNTNALCMSVSCATAPAVRSGGI